MTLRPIDARSGETRAAGLDGEATKAGCPKGRPNNPKEIRTMPDPLVEQTALVEAIITAYNTARPSHQSAADHILSKCFVTTAFMRFMAAMNGGTLPSVTEGREEIAREEEATAAFNAIIARMQEPDEAMIEAGEQVAVQPFIPAGKFTVLTWQAMLSSMEQG